MKAEKTQKHFSTPYYKNFYKFWSPYRVKISIFEKKLFRLLFLLKKLISHNFTFIKAKKTQKKVSTPFFKNVYKFWSPYRVKAEKTQKHFSTPFFKNFYKFWSPYRVKAEKTQKHFSTTFSKHFYKFWSPYRVKAEKTRKHFSTPYFKIFYKFWSPYRVKISIFEKKFSDNFFYSKNLFHTISHSLKPKKRKKKFQPHFSRMFTSSDPHIG